jgi:2'-5' RNA ligase
MASPIFAANRKPAPPAAAARLFIALWPEAAVREALYAQAAPYAALGRRLPARNLHVTLAFLGAVPAGRIEELARLLRSARPPACKLSFDRLGYFARTRVLWAGCSEVPAPLTAYQQRLMTALAGAGFRTEKRDFTPHVTLLRDAGRPPADLTGRGVPRAGSAEGGPGVPWTGASVPWAVREIALVDSELAAGGPRYTVLRRVPAAR